MLYVEYGTQGVFHAQHESCEHIECWLKQNIAELCWVQLSFIGASVEILLLDRAVLKKHCRCRFIFPCYV